MTIQTDQTQNKKLVTIHDYISWYRSLGFVVLPVPFGKKKSGIVWKRFQNHKPSNLEYKRWFPMNYEENLLIMCGRISGKEVNKEKYSLAVLDLDYQGLSHQLFEDWEGLLNSTVVVQSQPQKDKYHIYFWIKGECPNLDIKYKENPTDVPFKEILSLRSNGRYVIAPPSIAPVQYDT